MGKRLTKIVTRTGDDGSTGLGDGSRVSKAGLRVEALGDIDELNSAIGVILCESLSGEVRDALAWIQNDLFDLGAEVCVPGRSLLQQGHLARLDRLIESFNARLPPLNEFILPGGTRAAALVHLARAVCRRAERALVRLAQTDPANAVGMRFLNRLSDLLFIVGRVLNQQASCQETYWTPLKRGETQAS